MNTKTTPDNTPSPQTSANPQQKRDSGLDLIPALLFLLMTNWNTPTWSSSTFSHYILADTKRTAKAGLTLGIISTATAAAALITSILTACLT